MGAFAECRFVGAYGVGESDGGAGEKGLPVAGPDCRDGPPDSTGPEPPGPAKLGEDGGGWAGEPVLPGLGCAEPRSGAAGTTVSLSAPVPGPAAPTSTPVIAAATANPPVVTRVRRRR